MIKFGFRSTFKSMFNVKSWIGWDALRQNGSLIRSMYCSLLKPSHAPIVTETFEEACERYGYSLDFLKHQEMQFEQAAWVYFGLWCLGLSYMAWLFMSHKLLAGMVMIPLNFMLFSFYFRESFWLMQIRQRRLGMNFKDWFRIIVLRHGQTY